MSRPNVNEVDIDPVDLDHELRESIELRFCLAPVVLSSPVADDLLQFREPYALRPIVDRFAVGPPRSCDPLAKLGYFLLRDLDSEWADGFACARRLQCSGQQAEGAHSGCRCK
jgi:hypothetical protein